MEREELLKEVFCYCQDRDDSYKRNYLLSSYKGAVSNVYDLRKRLKAGIVKRTGKPYKPATLKTYKRELKDYENLMYNRKSAIKMLSDEGYFGNKKPKRGVISSVHYRAEKTKVIGKNLG